MAPARPTYTLNVAGLTRELPLFEIAPHLSIAVFNMLGDTELVQVCSAALAEKVAGIDFDILVTAEAKSIPLAYAMSVELRKPYIILRKGYKPYMGVALTSETLSITTGHPQMLYLDEKDHNAMRGKKVLIMDDVISTGSTLSGMKQLMDKAGAEIVATCAVLTEGDDDWTGIIALGNLPLFRD